ncbi:DUF461 domain-containing protein [Streptomyces stramineus]
MSSSLRRGTLAASALVLSIASLTACAAGNSAETLEVKPDNAATSVGDIKIQNVNVITQPDLAAKGPAVITGTLFNNGTKDQTLRGITLPGKNAAVKITPVGGARELVVPMRQHGRPGRQGQRLRRPARRPRGPEGRRAAEAQLRLQRGKPGEHRRVRQPGEALLQGVGPRGSPAAKPGDATPRRTSRARSPPSRVPPPPRRRRAPPVPRAPSRAVSARRAPPRASSNRADSSTSPVTDRHSRGPGRVNLPGPSACRAGAVYGSNL